MTDLHTSYLGLRLHSPIVASASPLTGDVQQLPELERAGAGAVVLPSLFEEQIEHDTNEIDRFYAMHSDSFGEATTIFPDIDDYNAGADHYLELVEQAKRAVDIPVIASLNGVNLGGWLRYGRLLESAGADAVELNLYTVAADPLVDAVSLESEQLELVRVLTDELEIPLAVKISPYYSALAAFVVAIQDSGASGVTLFNRFYQPDIDLESLEIAPRLALSSSDELRLPLRWAGILREYLRISIATSTGVHDGTDVAKLLLVGADVVMTTSALLKYGAGHIAEMERELRAWMTEHDYDAVDEMRGAIRSEAAPDPAGYERANYIGNLASYASRHPGAHTLPLPER